MSINPKKLNELFGKIINFNQARGWNPVAQDIAKSIVIEAAELLELYQWDASDRNLGSKPKPKDIDKIKAEVADVIWYIVTFCHQTGIDLADAVEYKLKHNEEKYPVEMFNGHHNDDFYKKRKTEYRQNKR